MQVALFGEFCDISSVLFTLTVTAVTWWLTSVKKLRSARLRVLLLTFGHFAAERSFFNPSLNIAGFIVSRRIGRLSLVSGIGLCIKMAVNEFVDFDKVNNSMLRRVVQESVEKTPAWFSKYKEDLIST